MLVLGTFATALTLGYLEAPSTIGRIEQRTYCEALACADGNDDHIGYALTRAPNDRTRNARPIRIAPRTME